MSKNIVIFSDGTGQEGGEGNNTNVYDLFNMIEDRTQRQITFYDRGLGTGWRKVSAASGGGITRNIQECYQFLSDWYSAGDQIYLFGFSRGATTVRTLSAFIHLFGILPRSRPELIRKAWRIYRIRNADRKRELADEFVHRNHTMWARVRFLGAWDTVAALGLPFKTIDLVIDKIPFFRHSFHDLTLAKSVDYARHALAVDDERLTFHPQLWDETNQEESGRLEDREPEHFTIEDIGDIYLVAEKLKSADHPVTKRLQLAESTQRQLETFNASGKRRMSAKRIEALEKSVVADFNKALFNAEDSIYDPRSADELEGIALSAATRELIGRFNKGRKNTIRWLDRLLIEDAYSLRPANRPRVKQVWFAGMHTDVGGGYPESELSHIALLWMVQEAIALGLRIYDKHRVDVHPDATGKMHDSRAKLGRLYRRRQRRWEPEKNQGRSPLVHESVVVRSRCDSPVYEPWILKTKYDLEPWPAQLMGSIQYDDHHIWREAMWGWGAAFAVPWNVVERIACDEQERTITLHLKGTRDDVVVRGCLPRSLSPLVSELERRREHKRLEEEDQRLRTQDQRLEEQDRRLQDLLTELKDKVGRLETHIQVDDDQTRKLKLKDEELVAENRQFSGEIEELKSKIAALERELPGARASADLLEH